jgi:hypothetical protein
MFSNLKEGTQLMAIYTPYFYIIQDVRNGMYYAGSKYGKDANPDNFMVEGGYETSSETIKEIIREHGFDNFIIHKIRTFETGTEAYWYEKRFLQKVDARNHPKFYNKHNNDYIEAWHPESYYEYMLKTYGVRNPMHSDIIKERIIDTNLRKRGVPWPMMDIEVRSKSINTCLSKYGVTNPSQAQEIKDKTKIANLEKYGVEYTLQLDEIKDKIKITNLDRYGVENVLQSPKIRNKIEATNLERYGAKNPFQSEIIKERIKETNLQRYGVEYYFKSDEGKEK